MAKDASVTITESQSAPQALTERIEKYDYKSLQYPSDLGSERFPHYVMFFINVNTKSQYFEQNTPEGESTRITAQREMTAKTQQDVRDVAGMAMNSAMNSAAGTAAKEKIDKYAPPGAKEIGAAVARVATKAIGNISLAKKTSRTNTAIMLYMPSTLQQSFKQSYAGTSATEALGLIGAASQLGGQAAAGYKTGGIDGLVNAMASNSGAVSEIAGKGTDLLASTGLVGKDLSKLIMSGSGMAVNPNEETLYQKPEFRSHQFTFDFFPRSVDEARNVRSIIRTFKAHSAPELSKTTTSRYFITPSEFEIEYSINDGVRPADARIGKVGVCVLEDITLDYAPDEFSVYHDKSHTHIRMQITFKEIEYITREMIEQEGF